jgi:putative salt-induced outer membrane protein
MAPKRILQPVLVALICAASSGAIAQSKADGLWRGSGGAALSASSGNTTASSLLLNADAARETATDKISLGGMINYAKSRIDGVDQTTSNKWAGHGQYDYKLSPRTFVFGRLGLEADKVIDLSLRSALAAGLGYKVVDTDRMSFELFGGLGYTSDKYSVAQTIGSKTDTRFSRASVYLGEASSHQLTPTVSLKQRLDLYPGISGDKAVLATFNAGLAVAMSSTLSLTVGLTDTYNSKPPLGTKSNDVGLFTGINVKFGAV